MASVQGDYFNVVGLPLTRLADVTGPIRVRSLGATNGRLVSGLPNAVHNSGQCGPWHGGFPLTLLRPCEIYRRFAGQRSRALSTGLQPRRH